MAFVLPLEIRDVKEHLSKLQYVYFLRWVTTERKGKENLTKWHLVFNRADSPFRSLHTHQLGKLF